MHSVVKWKKELSFEATTDKGHKIDLSGQGKAPSPMEVVLAGLGGCTGMDVISILEKMRLPVERFEVELSADRAQDHPKVFTKIEMDYKVWGENLPEDKVKRAVELTQEKYCSVLHMLNKTAEIVYRYKINPND